MKNLKIFENIIYLGILNKKLLKNVILEQTKFSYSDKFVFPIDENIVKRMINSIICESSDPDYFVKLPKDIELLTKEKFNEIISKDEILMIFPEMKQYKFPKIYIACFDFSNEIYCKNFLSSISKLKNKNVSASLKIALGMKNSGTFIDLTKFGVDIAFILLDEKTYNTRTIYHEWTHLFQTYIKKEEFFKIIDSHQDYVDEIEAKLNRFQLTIDGVERYFFSNKEYVARCDNLIYMIHQVQKLEKYKNLSDFEFFNIFKKTFSSEDPECMNSQLANDIISIKINYKMDILFFISCYICYKSCNEFFKLCNEIENRI